MNIKAGWTPDTLNYVMFIYSNRRFIKYGGQIYHYSSNTSEFILDSEENINGVTIYTGTRLINKFYEPNGTYLVVGLRLYTDNGRTSELFGSSNGIKMNEAFSNFRIAYVQGRAFGYVDALQFIWYRQISQSNLATLLI